MNRTFFEGFHPRGSPAYVTSSHSSGNARPGRPRRRSLPSGPSQLHPFQEVSKPRIYPKARCRPSLLLSPGDLGAGGYPVHHLAPKARHRATRSLLQGISALPGGTAFSPATFYSNRKLHLSPTVLVLYMKTTI